MNLSSIFPALGETPTVDNSAVGTVEQPFETHGLVHVPTGRNAQRSESARWQNFVKNPERFAEVSLPVDGRAQRRAAAARQRRDAKKGRRAFVNRQWAQEREASDLRNLFAILDGDVLARPEVQDAAWGAIDARVTYLQNQQEQAGQDVQDAHQIAQRLRDLAGTARPDMGRRSRIAADKLSQQVQEFDQATGHPVVG